VRTTGEVDVAFAVDGVRYVMEVKWTSAPADTGQIAKLQKRVRQRLLGTYGVFLSMSGYSAPALADIADGERLEVLLLDGDHFAAMISGEVSPGRLLSLIRDRAAFYGRAYTPMAELRYLLASTSPVAPARSPLPSPPLGMPVSGGGGLPPTSDGRGADMFVFTGRRAVYWVITALFALFSVLAALLVFIPPELTAGGLAGAVVVVVTVVLTIGFLQMARHPVRLIIGPRGIQLSTWRYGTTWLPWDKIQSIQVVNVYGGPHVVVKTSDAAQYPTLSDGSGIRPRYLPNLNAISLCPSRRTTHQVRSTRAPRKRRIAVQAEWCSERTHAFYAAVRSSRQPALASVAPIFSGAVLTFTHLPHPARPCGSAAATR